MLSHQAGAAGSTTNAKPSRHSTDVQCREAFDLSDRTLLRCRSGDEAITSADGCHLQVQAGVLGVAALIDQHHVGFFAAQNADKDIVPRVRLAEMTTQTALPVVN